MQVKYAVFVDAPCLSFVRIYHIGTDNTSGRCQNAKMLSLDLEGEAYDSNILVYGFVGSLVVPYQLVVD